MTNRRNLIRTTAVAAVAATAIGAVALPSAAGAATGTSTTSPAKTSTMASGTASRARSAPTATKTAKRVTTLRVSVAPNGAMRFTPSKLTARHGTVRLILTNPKTSGKRHGIAIRGHGVRVVGRIVGPGHTTTVTVRLKRGTYTFYCPVPGHAAAGMKGTLRIS